jgi:L-ascorbate metabolism protein UlaG (beta-lactamase superfamily)
MLSISRSLCTLAALAFLAPLPLQAQEAEPCPKFISMGPARIQHAKVQAEELGLTFVGHATFLIETPSGLRIATDFNDYVRPSVLPDIITMNKAHSTHFTTHPDPRIPNVLRGWGPNGAPADHDVTIGDVRIRNVVTNIRNWNGGTEYDGNSIFVFEASQLCVAHLGHLHHELTEEHLKQIGRIDVVLVPVDGSYTIDQTQMMNVLKQLSPSLIIPMHFFGRATLDRFLALARETWPVEVSPAPSIILSRATLPVQPKVLVLPGH